MKIRQPDHIYPTYANVVVIDPKRGEIVINLCFAEGEVKDPSICVVHKVVMTTENFERFIQIGQEALKQHAFGFGDA